VRLWTLFADVLADLKLAQLLDHIRSDYQPDEQRGERGEGRTKREIAKDPEWPEVRKELLIEQPVKQKASARERP
jgi:hypothetical protein